MPRKPAAKSSRRSAGVDKPATPKPTDSRPTARYALLLLLGVACFGFLLHESVLATLIIVTDGAIVLLIWLAALGLGWWTLSLIGLNDEPLRWQLALGAGLGMGLLSLLMLALGSVGLLGRWLWIALLGVMILATVLRAGLAARSAGLDARVPRDWLTTAHWLWLACVPFALLALLAATIPPGLNWSGEAGGYDVLEYHFGGPKEYWLAGRITPLPHNLYTYLPFGAEMLYLLAFVIKGDPFEGIYLAQLLNASLAIGAVAAAWLAGRELGRLSGVVAGVLVGVCPWLVYLSGVAYVENGLLMMSMVATACVVRLLASSTAETRGLLIAAGLAAGFACGFKLTAGPMIALPVGLVVAWFMLRRRPRRWMGVGLYAAGVMVAFCPWMIKNTLQAGNPVFPMRHETFGYRPGLWTDDLAEQWDRAHSPPEQDRPMGARLKRLWQRVIAEPRIGAMLFVAGGVGVVATLAAARSTVLSGVAALGLLMLIVQLVMWLFATHLLARFAVLVILPLALLAAAGAAIDRTSRVGAAARKLLVSLVVLSACVNLVWVGRLYYDHTRDRQGRPFGWFGADHLLAQQNAMNQFTPPTGSTVWMVGEARAFYVARPCIYHVVFSRNPLAEWARDDPSGEATLAWLRERGVTHVYINYSEIDRFGASGNYGWPASLDEAFFDSIRDAGARLIHAERDTRTGRMIYELLEVPAP